MDKPSFLKHLLWNTLLIGGCTLVVIVFLAGLVGLVAVTFWVCKFGIIGLTIECLVLLVLFIFASALYEYFRDLKKYKKTEK